MKLIACPRTLQISLIDFTDFSYDLSPDRDFILDETFINSIARHGILHPPIIRETDSGSYLIVTGRKRLSAFRSLYPEADTCCCLIISHTTQDIEVYSVALEEILISRKLSPIEKALLLKKLSPLADVEYIANEFLPRMDLPPDPLYIRQSLMLLDLEKPIIHAIHRGEVHESVARDFSSFPAADRMSLFHIMTSLRLGINYQKKLVTTCRELANREQQNITELLKRKEVSLILNHPDANPPQKTKNLMTWLARKHMPRSSQAEDEFTSSVAAMKLPGNVTIQHTPFFENDAVTLAITFTDRKCLQDSWKKIRHALQEKND